MTLLPKPKIVKLLQTHGQQPIKKPKPTTREDYTRISYDTRQFVWTRDGGKCCHCNSTDKLQFDHIIPASLGGAGVAANFELLCSDCNNRKKARLQPPTSRS
ncbi:MAG: HNH endonuclease [Erythrobacter sp.]